ncbi:MAG: hypothetical protein FGM37_11220 [Phycisphaerales bacterium]|nr:hypothetical protein [Phycisphaerales bacterium]
MTAIAGVIVMGARARDLGAARTDLGASLRAALHVYGRDAWDEWRYERGEQLRGEHPRGEQPPSVDAPRDHPRALFVRALLRTLPEDVHDRQPLWHEASGTALIFDGRIDNRDEIARALGIGAAELAQLSDSDVALRVALEWDTSAAERLRGAFAVACWQPARRRLWLARDAMGHRPLFWHQSQGMLAFASMPAGLLALPGVSCELDELSVARALMLDMHPYAQTIHRDIQRVEAGRVVEFVDGAVSVRRFHQLDPQRELRLARDEDYVDAFREVLERAVARCLRSCGPVASQLSSGYDSTTVTAVAARLLAARGERLTAYTSVPREGFAGPVPKGREADESVAAAALVARLPNVDHVRIRSSDRSVLETARVGGQLLGKPQRNPCNGPWIAAIYADAAARGARVVLTGQCGNATISLQGQQLLQVLFAQGRLVEWFREASALRALKSSRTWKSLIRQSVAPLVPMWLIRRRDRARMGTNTTPPEWSPINPALYAQWRARGELEGLKVHSRARSGAGARLEAIRMLERIELGEFTAVSNAAGVDLRDPTKDQDLVEFCVSVPLGQLSRRGQNRWLLRRAMAGVLPPEIMECQAKGYQAADWFEHMGAELPQVGAELQRLQACREVSRFVDLDALGRSLSGWPTGGWENPAVQREFRLRLPRGLAVGMFIHDASGGA